VDADTLSCIRTAAVMAHKALGCAGYSRSDFILTRDQELFILELNTLPGFTRTSLLPQGAASIGISFGGLVNRIVSAAIRRQAEMPWVLRGEPSKRTVPTAYTHPDIASSAEHHSPIAG
jgi:D-alanine-D-alanine ligase